MKKAHMLFASPIWILLIVIFAQLKKKVHKASAPEGLGRKQQQQQQKDKFCWDYANSGTQQHCRVCTL